jgi:hypothetical protein
MTVSGAVVAPAAPGALGQAPAAADVLSYLHDLGSWRDARRQELDALDQAALASPERDALSGDVVLSMALWQAVADRYAALLRLWDSGRVGRTELDQISSLIWGRLDAAPQSMNISLPEACRLSDALAGSLRVRLSLEPGAGDVAGLVRRFREQVERIRDLVVEAPPDVRASAGEQLDRLDRRLDDFTERARRGADVGGLVEALTNDLARAERDLIVAAATRTRVRQSTERARTLVARLTARGAQVRALRQECLARVTPIPRLAVPDVTALGPVPTNSGALDAYVERLEAVQRALGLAHSAYQACLQEPDELEGLVEGYHAKAAATGVANTDLCEIYGRAREVLDSPPVDVRRLRALVSAYQAYLESADKPSRPGGVR